MDSLAETGEAGQAFCVCEDFLDDLGGNNRAGGGLPTYLYKSSKINKALEEVAEGEVFLFVDVDIQFLKPVRHIVDECMASGVDLLFQKEFEDIGVNIGFMAMRNTEACRAFWKYVHGEIVRTQCLDQRVVNNSLYSGHAAKEFGLRHDRWPSCIWASSMAFSGPLPENPLIHHANFLVEKATAGDCRPKLEQLKQLQTLIRSGKDVASDEDWSTFITASRESPAMLDYRARHFGARRPGPEWSTLEEGHIARPGGYSEKTAQKAARAAAKAAAAAAATAEHPY